jgi:hypothetical protein
MGTSVEERRMKYMAVILLGLWVAGPAFATGELEPQNPEEPEAVAQDADPMAPAVPNPEVAPTPEPAAPPPQGSVARAVFTTGIVDREPADAVEQLSADHDRVFFFTELSGMDGQTATHRWEFGGEVVAEVPFDVGGQRWRVYSSKQLQPGWVGTWTVTVVDAAGRELSRSQLDFLPAPEVQPSEEPPAAETTIAPAAPAPEDSPAAP